MAEEKEERRINIRVPSDLFDLLDQKRFEERTSWQELGLAFFVNWLRTGEKPVVEIPRLSSPFDDVSEAEQEKLLAYLHVLREAKEPELVSDVVDLWSKKMRQRS